MTKQPIAKTFEQAVEIFRETMNDKDALDLALTWMDNAFWDYFNNMIDDIRDNYTKQQFISLVNSYAKSKKK